MLELLKTGDVKSAVRFGFVHLGQELRAAAQTSPPHDASIHA
jgi:hypothetical protein